MEVTRPDQGCYRRRNLTVPAHRVRRRRHRCRHDRLFGGGTVACSTTGTPTNPIAGYNPEQIANAATIVAVGKRMQVPEHGLVIAIATALQESGLRNLDHGDRDSLGLFQQRPSQGWGTPTQLTDPTYAATAFYRRLLEVPGWQQMSVNQAAQAVQRSATPTPTATTNPPHAPSPPQSAAPPAPHQPRPAAPPRKRSRSPTPTSASPTCGAAPN
jgi:hypothetical protein